jgi:DNA-binding NtrC family response regulator
VSAAHATVLVLEDDPALLDLLCLAIDGWGHRALPAVGGPEALRLAGEEASIDLAFADVGLLDRASGDVLQGIRAFHPGLRFVYMSGYRPPSAAPLDDASFLQKPFALQELEDAIIEALG